MKTSRQYGWIAWHSHRTVGDHATRETATVGADGICGFGGV